MALFAIADLHLPIGVDKPMDIFGDKWSNWWDTVGKLEKYVTKNCYADIHFMQNNSYLYKGVAICGTRGWVCPGSDNFSQDDEKIYARELARAELSLESSLKYNAQHTIFFMHYPPAKSNQSPDEGFSKIFANYGVEKVVYGHIHGNGHYSALIGEYERIQYILASADYLEFKPLKIFD